MHYEENGIVGLDMVATNPAYGGNPALRVSEQFWTFALPRKVPIRACCLAENEAERRRRKMGRDATKKKG